MQAGVFRTILEPVKKGSISHQSKILMTGSCFSEHIGRKLEERKFDIIVNPFGILYHPLALASAFGRMIEKKPFTAEDITFTGGRHVSFMHHGRFNNPDKKVILSRINAEFEKGCLQLASATHLFITWGTAFGYELSAKPGRVVANCHKIPQKQFVKILTSPKRIIDNYRLIFERLKENNPGLQIILTVSPVKHIREGLVNNNLSKSVLIYAAHQLVNGEDIIYFPAYELLTDDLRDYRFYASDMAHPSEEAVNYIWEFFKDSWWNDRTRAVNREVESVLNRLNHQPLHPETEEYGRFRKRLKEDIEKLVAKYPRIGFKNLMNAI